MRHLQVGHHSRTPQRQAGAPRRRHHLIIHAHITVGTRTRTTKTRHISLGTRRLIPLHHRHFQMPEGTRRQVQEDMHLPLVLLLVGSRLRRVLQADQGSPHSTRGARRREARRSRKRTLALEEGIIITEGSMIVGIRGGEGDENKIFGNMNYLYCV